MNKKIIFIVLLILALSLTLVACEEIDPPTGSHEHTFASEWSKDADNHWHKATCEHTDEVSGKASHSFKPVVEGNIEQCDVCGCTRNALTPNPNPHEHTFKTEYTADEHSHWLETTCGHEVENAAPHSFADGVCQTCGWWSSASEALFANLSKSELWDFTVMFNDVVLKNGVNLLSEGIEHADVVISGELKLTMTDEGAISGYGYLRIDEQSYKAVIIQNVVTACCGEDYIRCNLDDLLKQNGVDVEELLDTLNANTQQIREYVDQIKGATANLPIDGAIVDALLASLVKVDEEKSTDSLTAYVADVELLRQLNQTLATTTVEQYVNAFLAQLDGTPLGVLLGNSIDGLPDRICSLLKNPIYKTIAELWAEDFKLDDLFNQLNGFISEYYPDDKVNTIDELVAAMGIDLGDLAKRFGVSVKNLTVKQLVEACSLFSPETLWNLAQEDDSTKISADAISNQLKEYTEAYADKTVYEIIVADNDEFTADDVKAFVDGMADWLEQNVSIEFYVNADNVLQQIIVNVDGQTLTLKRDGELQQDYSDIEDYIDENNVTVSFA